MDSCPGLAVSVVGMDCRVEFVAVLVLVGSELCWVVWSDGMEFSELDLCLFVYVARH